MSPPIQTVQLGNLSLPNRYFLAPLAGVSDWPFRLLCRELGASIAHTEMISSHGLVHGGDQTLTYLERPEDERPFAIQVFGHDPDVLAAGARVAVEQYGPVDAVDINMGCPVKKVCCHGAGAAMLKDPLLVERTVRKVVEAVGPLPVTVKLRAGWDEEHKNAPEIARACEQGGAVGVGLHPRTRAQLYRGRADWDLIRRTKEAVKISVWGSGDLFTAEAAMRMLRETGADAARIARGACGYPWIFRELLALERGETPPEVTLAEWRAMILRHVALAIADKQGRYRLHRRRGRARTARMGATPAKSWTQTGPSGPPSASCASTSSGTHAGAAGGSPSAGRRPICTPRTTSGGRSIATSRKTARCRPKCATSPWEAANSPPKTSEPPARPPRALTSDRVSTHIRVRFAPLPEWT